MTWVIAEAGPVRMMGCTSRGATTVQYLVAAASHVASLDSITGRLVDLDPAALVDIDASGRLRISTLLADAEVLLALGLAGLAVAASDIERVPSQCCGGCGG